MVIERLNQLVDFKGIKKSEFYNKVGLSNGFLDKSRDVGTSKLESVLKAFPDVNPIWLLTGEGEMIISEGKVDFSENEIVNYLIINSERLLSTNRNFKVWYDNMAAKAKHDFMKELLTSGISLSTDLEKSLKGGK